LPFYTKNRFGIEVALILYVEFNEEIIMKKIVLIILIFTFSLLLAEKMVVRIDDPSSQTFRYFQEKNYDIASYNPDKYLDLVVTQEQYNQLQKAYDIKVTQTEQELKTNLRNSKELDYYRNYEEVLAELQSLEETYPDICKLYDIGETQGKIYSEEGHTFYDNYNHEIWALKVSDNVEQQEDEPGIYYLGPHHSREPLSTEVVMTNLLHILENYGSDATITANVDNSQIWFVPIVNPNGHKIVIDENDVWWRKNMRDNNNDHNFDTDYYSGYGDDGVDVNRNYGWEWGLVGASDNINDPTYHGPEPFSEPETETIKQFMADNHFVAGIGYHTYGQLVLYPYGYTSGAYAPDHEAISTLGIEMANMIPGHDGGSYTPQNAWELYSSTGGIDDYAYGEHGIFSYTIELATEFIPPASVVSQVTQNNIDAAMHLLDRVNHSTLTGHITDETTGLPVQAQVYIPEIDDYNAYKKPYRADADFGRYYRLLPPGEYDVYYKAYGYETENISVILTTTGQTIQDVQLQPATVVSLSGYVTDSDNGEPIVGANLQILDTPIEPVHTNSEGAYIFPEVFSGSYQVFVTADNYISVLQDVELTESTTLNFSLIYTEAESFESPILPAGWVTSGAQDWQIDETEAYDGFNSVKSGVIGNNQETSLEVTKEAVTGGEIVFWQKVSSESGYDFLQFYIDDVLQDEWSGIGDWSEQSYNVEAGEHTYTWKYKKDIYVSDGQDCGWIDYVIFPPEDETATGGQGIPMQTKLIGNYPNPFNPTTTIKFAISAPQQVEISIFNLKGQKVRSYNQHYQEPGNYSIVWNGNDDEGKPAGTGIYFYKLKTSAYSQIKKMMLLK